MCHNGAQQLHAPTIFCNFGWMPWICQHICFVNSILVTQKRAKPEKYHLPESIRTSRQKSHGVKHYTISSLTRNSFIFIASKSKAFEVIATNHIGMFTRLHPNTIVRSVHVFLYCSRGHRSVTVIYPVQRAYRFNRWEYQNVKSESIEIWNCFNMW